MNPYSSLDGKLVEVTWSYFEGGPANVVTRGILEVKDFNNMIIVGNAAIGIALISTVSDESNEPQRIAEVEAYRLENPRS